MTNDGQGLPCWPLAHQSISPPGYPQHTFTLFISKFKFGHFQHKPGPRTLYQMKQQQTTGAPVDHPQYNRTSTLAGLIRSIPAHVQ
ncbi:hypothetical protein AVEN_8531-1 [Araneus ventricosus]|uniref:Uncharacterized protein n=1 Tax=Araneus ventricosus TaxID=182803 RepID=A0A4Y2FNE9_ARAVE|nr:hypothetical protein AVEN_8531-1 [Araneus ventricosus]